MTDQKVNVDQGVSMSNEIKAKEYQRRQLELGLLQEISTVLFLMVWVWISPWVAGLFNFGGYKLLIIFCLLSYVSYQALFFVLDYLSDYRLEHEYELSTENFRQWLWRHGKVILLGGVLLGVLVVLLYTAVWYVKYWYIWCWLAWVLLSVIFAQVFPVLILPIFYKSKRLEHVTLLDRFRKMAEGTGLSVEGIYKLELSSSTKKGNAMLAGLGRTRRVMLGDTLLEKLTEDEISVVYAHELGHHVFRHFWKILFLHSVGSIVLFGLIYAVLNPVAWEARELIVRLPLLALVMTLFTFFWRPVLYGFSRWFENECDRYALEKTQSPKDFVSAFEKLADQNLADRNPPRWVVWLFHDHPAIGERIEAAKRF